MVAAPQRDLPRLADWQLLQPLSRGPWSTTFAARPRDAGDGPADYVLKLVHDDCDWELAVAALRREARVSAEVTSPHLISVLTTHFQNLPYYLVTPFLAGATVRRLIERGPIATARQIWIGRQIADALHTLHSSGWMHADVKPDNILVAPNGHVTLIDLGFARRLDTEECTSPVVTVGTPGFMAPETAGSQPRMTDASDIYSLGRIMEEMRIAGKGEDRPEYEERLSSLIEAMIATDPAGRPGTRQLVRELIDLEIGTIVNRASGERKVA